LNKTTVRRVLWIGGGAIAGFAWYYFVGCVSGSCPITSNPYISTGYGALMGFLLAGSTTKERKEKQEEKPE